MRISRIAAAAASLAVSLAACSTGSSGTGAKDAGTGAKDAKITVYLGQSVIGKSLEALVSGYTEKTGRKVDVQILAEQQMRDKITLNLQSKSSNMDVYMTLPSREGPLYLSSGYYEPLADYMSKASADYNAKDFAKGANDSVSVNGKVVAAPMNIAGPVLYYRKDILKTLDIAVPTTIDELIAAAKKISEKGDGSYVPIAIRGQADALAFTFAPFYHADGLSWLEGGKPTFTDPRAATAIEQYATLAGKYGPKGVINYSFNEATNLFAAGGAAFFIDSSNILGVIIDPTKSAVADRTGVANVPGGKPAVISWGLAMSPFSVNKSAAWDFIEWATSKDTQLATALTGLAPPRTSIYKSPKYIASLDTDVKKAMLEANLYIAANGNPEVSPVALQAAAIQKIIGDGVGGVIVGQSTPAASAESIQQQIAPLIDK